MEALSIGNKHQKKHGASQNLITLKPPGPCPKCKDYRYWHYAKDCHAVKCRNCNKYGHKSTKCITKRNKNRFNYPIPTEKLTYQQYFN